MPDNLDLKIAQRDSQNDLIKEFLQIASNRCLLNATLRNYLNSSEKLLKNTGIHGVDLKPSVKEILDELTEFYDPSAMIKTSTSLQLSRFLLSPTEYIMEIGRVLVESTSQKEILKSRFQIIGNNVKGKSRGLTSMKADANKVLQEAINNAQKRSDCLLPENLEMLSYTSEICQANLSKLKETKNSQKVNSVGVEQIKELLEKHAALKMRNEKLSSQLTNISENHALPPNLSEAQVKFEERKKYLQSIIQEISSLEESSNSFSTPNKSNESYVLFH